MRLVGRFHCEPHEVLALVGPSGAGKTSMLRVLAGLMRSGSGRVRVGDELWWDAARGLWWPPQRRRVGLVFQNYALMPHLSARDNVALSLLELPRHERQRVAGDWLARMGLDAPTAQRLPGALSGGQQQRVALARALARTPRLLLLDEPFSAVDEMSRRGLYQLLAALRKELEIPILLVTHNLHEARLLADRLIVIDHGEVLQQGSPEAIYRKPRNARVADLVGIQNRFHGSWVGPSEQAGVGLMRWHAGNARAPGPLLRVPDKGRLPTGQTVVWILPGDGVALRTGEPAREDEFAVQVTELRLIGELTLATLALEALPGDALRLTLARNHQPILRPGARLCARLDLQLVHVMPLR